MRKSRGIAVSVGAVGGAGGAGGAYGAGGVGGPGGGPSSAQAVTPSAGAAEVGEHSVNEVSNSTDDDKKSMGAAPQSTNIHINNNNAQMSTQDFMQLRQTSSCNEMQDTSMIDFKKIIEMMMAIQLLKAMNENSGQ